MMPVDQLFLLDIMEKQLRDLKKTASVLAPVEPHSKEHLALTRIEALVAEIETILEKK